MASVDMPANVSENMNCSGVADFSVQISSAVKVMKSTLESVFGSGKSCQAERTLGYLMRAELYRRRNMPVWTRWIGLQATASYKQYLAKFGDDGLGAIGRCRDMFVRLGGGLQGQQDWES